MRLFVGIFPPASAVAHLGAALAGAREAVGVRRWQPPERWHLTLAFLGEREPHRIEHLQAALAASVAGVPAPRLRLEGSGTFRTGRGAGALWIGVQEVGLPLLAERVAAAVGDEVDSRPFRAHVTVARWRPPERPVADPLSGYRGPEWPAAEVVLVRSRLGPQPSYESIARWPLTDGGDHQA